MMLSPLMMRAQFTFTVKGIAGTLNAPAMAYLSYMEPGGKMVQDSAMLHHGAFLFSGTISAPVIARLTLAHKGENRWKLKGPDNAGIMLDSGVTVVTTNDSLVNAVVDGTPLIRDYAVLTKKRDAAEARLITLTAQYQATPKAQQDSKAFGELYAATYAEVRQTVLDNDFLYINKHPHSRLSVILLLSHMAEAPLDSVDAAYHSLEQPLQESGDGARIAGMIGKRKAVLVGGKAPDFSLPDTAGKLVALSSYRGKYVLVDFWASWCKPCRAENPNVVKTYAAYKDKNFTVLGVSLDFPGDREKWVNAIAADHLGQWAQVSDLSGWRSEVVGLFKLKGIPQNLLIGPDGVIIAKNLRGSELGIKLSGILNQQAGIPR